MGCLLVRGCLTIDQMLVELRVVDDPERVGFYSGLIVSPDVLSFRSQCLERSSTSKESIFAVMSLLTSMSPASSHSDFLIICHHVFTVFPTSYASDRYGRKPVILWGITGLGFSLIFFGMSRTFLALVLSRCIGGGMGGVWA